ncbi:SDN1 [Symbiodinium natans]|uniref:SDN1 protein n=1 Tax=Symbiodinium natans TaxID=878477 RepID=A0A812GAR1_9DINO|nr:SDN1 [Symbiodinium natans]
MRRSAHAHQLGEGDARNREVEEYRSVFLRQTANSALVKPGKEIGDTPRASTERSTSVSAGGSRGSRSVDGSDLEADFGLELGGARAPRAHGGSTSATSSTASAVDLLASRYSVTVHGAKASDFLSEVGVPLARIASESPYESPANSPPAVSPVASNPLESSEASSEPEGKAASSEAVEAGEAQDGAKGRLQTLKLPESPRHRANPLHSMASDAMGAQESLVSSVALQEYVAWLEARHMRHADHSPLASQSAERHRPHSSTVNSSGSILFPQSLLPEPADVSAANSLASSTAAELLGSRAAASSTLREYILWLEVQDAQAEAGRGDSCMADSLASSDHAAETSRAVEKYCAWRQSRNARSLDKLGSSSLDSVGLMSNLHSSPSSDSFQQLLNESPGRSANALREYRQQLDHASRRVREDGDSKKRLYTVISLPPLDEAADYMVDGLFTSSDMDPSSGNGTASSRLLRSSSGSHSTTRAQLLSKSAGSQSSMCSHPEADKRLDATLGSLENESDAGFLNDQLLCSESSPRSPQRKGRRFERFEATAKDSDATSRPQDATCSGNFYGSGSVIKQQAKWPRPLEVNPENLQSFES